MLNKHNGFGLKLFVIMYCATMYCARATKKLGIESGEAIAKSAAAVDYRVNKEEIDKAVLA